MSSGGGGGGYSPKARRMFAGVGAKPGAAAVCNLTMFLWKLDASSKVAWITYTEWSGDGSIEIGVELVEV